MSGFFPFGGQSGAPGSGLPAGTATGQLLVWDGSAWVPSSNVQTQFLSWGVGGALSAGSGVMYTWFVVGNPGSAVEASNGIHLIPRAGTIDLLTAGNINPTAGADLTMTVRLNSVATALTVSYTSSSTGIAVDAVNSINVVPGDRISLLYTSTAVIACRPTANVRYRFT